MAAAGAQLSQSGAAALAELRNRERGDAHVFCPVEGSAKPKRDAEAPPSPSPTPSCSTPPAELWPREAPVVANRVRVDGPATSDKN